MIDPYDGTVHLWSSAIAEITLDRKQCKAFLHATGGSILRIGRLCDIKSQHLGAGVYRITAKERTY